jgi:hypothetical protein
MQLGNPLGRLAPLPPHGTVSLMSARTSSRSVARRLTSVVGARAASASLGGLVGLLAVGLTVAACKNSEAAPATQKAPAAVTEGGTGAASHDAESYTVKITAPAGQAVGKESTAEIILAAKPGFHVNNEFPIKFTPGGSDGVDAKVVGKDAATVVPEKATIKVPFTPTRAGKGKLAGKLAFSVCSDSNCLMDKVELSVDVDVK